MTSPLALLKEHYEHLTTGNLDATVQLFAEDIVTVTPNGTLNGRAEFRALGEAFDTAMSDMRHEIVRSWEFGDTAVVEAVFSGRHTGPLATPDGEIPATGNQVSFPYADFVQVRDGVCVSHRIYWDNVALMSQIGALG